MSTLLLVLTVAPPAVAALVAARAPAPLAARLVVAATGSAAVAALALAVAVGIDGPASAVLTADGDVVAGLVADRVAVVLALVTTGVGVVVQSYAGRSLVGDPRARRFAVLAAVVTSATTLVALSATLTGLVAAWVVVGIALAALVAHRDGWAPATGAARRVRSAFLPADLILVGATIVVLAAVGDLDLRSPDAAADRLAGESIPLPGGELGLVELVATVLVLAGIARSALVPLHRWLPGTVAAPTPVSALLHAGVVNGAGVLLVRFAPTFGDSAFATHLAFATGAATAVLATGVMLVRTDVKGSLAWSTSGQMGFMVVQCAVGAFPAAVVHLAGHGMYKASLFLGSGDAIRARVAARHRPATPSHLAPAARLALVVLVPGLALALGYTLFDPHLPLAGDLLVVVFAWLTAARALTGWLHAGPGSPAGTVISGAVGGFAVVLAYLAGLRVIEGFLAPALPSEVAEPVGAGLLGATLALVGVGAVVLARAPGTAGDRLRLRVQVALLATGTSPVTRVDRAPSPAVAPVAGPRPLAPVEGRPVELIADVARAGGIVAPQWPLTSFVAVNPLGGLQHRPFDEATRLATRWSGARTHLDLDDYRRMLADGDLAPADLHAALDRVVPELAARPALDLDGRQVPVRDLLVTDLVHGPAAPPSGPRPTAAERWLGACSVPDAPAVTGAVDAIVGGLCAAHVDEAGVPWALPDRQRGLYAVWRDVAPHHRRVRRLLGGDRHRWLCALPERAEDALHAALLELGVDDDDRVDELRAQLLRLPGWAGYARWRDEWAEHDHPGPPLRLVDLLAVRVGIEAALVGGSTPTAVPAARGVGTDERVDDGADLAERVATVLAHRGGDPARPEVTTALADTLGELDDHTRRSVWLAAHEHRIRSELLGLVRAAPAPTGPDRPRPAAQAVFCIDVRSEGLRRHLEALGSYETLGFAGFFGVPVRWRPAGSPRGEARCPVLVSPAHEATERAEQAAELSAHLAAERRVAAGLESYHEAKGHLGSPFTLAEAAGWFLGPVAAARTLVAPHRWPATLRNRRSSPTTTPVIAAEDALDTGMTIEERALFAEAILTTVGLTTGLAPLVLLCGHGSRTVNNPHGSALDCGACGGAPGGASARVAAAILNDPVVREALLSRGIAVPADTWFVAGEHETTADRVTVLDRHLVPERHAATLATLEADLARAGALNAEQRAARLPGDPRRVRERGLDWAQVRPEWGLAGNAAFIVGPRAMTEGIDLGGRAFLHSYDADDDTEGAALETIMTAPLVVAQWISAQYYFSSVDPDTYGAGDKMLHNPVGGVGVTLGEPGDLRVGLPLQSVAVGGQRAHQPVRLLAMIQAPFDRIDTIIERNEVLRELVGGDWITVAARPGMDDDWAIRSPDGTWSRWAPASSAPPVGEPAGSGPTGSADDPHAAVGVGATSMEVR